MSRLRPKQHSFLATHPKRLLSFCGFHPKHSRNFSFVQSAGGLSASHVQRRPDFRAADSTCSVQKPPCEAAPSSPCRTGTAAHGPRLFEPRSASRSIPEHPGPAPCSPVPCPASHPPCRRRMLLILIFYDASPACCSVLLPSPCLRRVFVNSSQEISAKLHHIAT